MKITVSAASALYYRLPDEAYLAQEPAPCLDEYDINPDLVGAKLVLLQADDQSSKICGLSDTSEIEAFGRTHTGRDVSLTLINPAF